MIGNLDISSFFKLNEGCKKDAKNVGIFEHKYDKKYIFKSFSIANADLPVSSKIKPLFLNRIPNLLPLNLVQVIPSLK